MVSQLFWGYGSAKSKHYSLHSFVWSHKIWTPNILRLTIDTNVQDIQISLMRDEDFVTCCLHSKFGFICNFGRVILSRVCTPRKRSIVLYQLQAWTNNPKCRIFWKQSTRPKKLDAKVFFLCTFLVFWMKQVDLMPAVNLNIFIVSLCQPNIRIYPAEAHRKYSAKVFLHICNKSWFD